MTVAILMSLSWLGAAGVCAEQKPLALIGMENARRTLHTGHVMWSTRCNLPRKDDGIVYRWHSYDVPRYFTSRFTSDEYMVEDNGDPNGVVYPAADGGPDPELGYLPMRYLWYQGDQWNVRGRGLGAELYRDHRDAVDVRTIGLAVGLGLGTTCDDLFRPSAGQTHYEVRDRDGLQELIIQRENSTRTVSYLIDPARGWNPVHVRVVSEDRVLYEARSTLKQYDGVWFPEHVELYDYTHENGEEPLYVIEVLSASFNQPDHPKRLTPESIGVDVGTNIDAYADGLISRPLGLFGWDHEKLISPDELYERIRSGELKVGPGVRAEAQRSQALGLGIGRVESDWEQYVRRFIEKYRLNAEQQERAHRILRRCQEQANRYLTRHKDEIEGTRSEVRALSDPTRKQSTKRSERMQQLKERMLKLRAPLTQIFYGSLVPGLEKLPTRAQRKAVAEREESGAKP